LKLVVKSNASIAIRLATLGTAAACLLLTACADTLDACTKTTVSCSKTTNGNRRHSPAPTRKADSPRADAAARLAATAPLPAEKPAPTDTLFDSRRLEGTGTLPLYEIMTLVRQAPRLHDEVETALHALNKTPQEITCIGKRVGGRWRHLAGARVQPYTCRIGDQWLEISADLRITGSRGEGYQMDSDVAAENAKEIKETNPRWNWTNEKPPHWFLE